MSQIEMIEELVEPLVKSGVYKDRISAFRAIIIDYIDRKRTEYNGVISCFERNIKRTSRISQRALPIVQPLKRKMIGWNGKAQSRC